MNKSKLSKAFSFKLRDGDTIWPATVAGSYRISRGGEDHNVRGKGERDVSEQEMIDGVLNNGKFSRFRSESGARSKAPNHFSINSARVVEVGMNVGGVCVVLYRNAGRNFELRSARPQ